MREDEALTGTVIEIPTSRGLAHAICSHYVKGQGYLIRVFDGFLTMRPQNCEAILERPILFSAFFPLRAALKLGMVEKAGVLRVPEELKSFPLFKSRGLSNPETGKTIWWLWDGQRSWKVGDLTEEQLQLPSKAILNYKMLVAFLEKDLWQKHLF